MFGIDQRVLLRFLGFMFVLMGLAVRFGGWKTWYWRSRGGAYAYLPLGLLFILYTYNDAAQEGLGPYFFLYWVAVVILAVFCLWWVARPPAFIKPKWVRWIDKFPRQIKDAMATEVESGVDWQTHIQSEEAVDQWAKKLRGKLPKKSKKTK